MIRDSIKSLTYYEEYLEYEYNRIEKFENAIKEVIAARGEDEAVLATYSSGKAFILTFWRPCIHQVHH